MWRLRSGRGKSGPLILEGGGTATRQTKEPIIKPFGIPPKAAALARSNPTLKLWMRFAASWSLLDEDLKEGGDDEEEVDDDEREHEFDRRNREWAAAEIMFDPWQRMERDRRGAAFGGELEPEALGARFNFTLCFSRME